MAFNFEATGIGSLPFKDPETACRIIFGYFTDIPFWPQLPKRSFLESMYVQFSEGLPGVVVDEKKKTIHLDSEMAAKGMEGVYERYIAGETDFFRISERYAEGFYRFLGSIKNEKARFVKGHITGPVSFALSLTDQNKRSVIYDQDLFEMLTKVLSMKARWQIKKLKEKFPNIIIFIDEPYLVSLGSSYVTVNIEEAGKRLDEVIASVKESGALCGVHCCGNTDWPFLLKRDIDILNFDMYNFLKEFLLYTEDIKNFFTKGGTIAWGAVPSSDAVDKETKITLVDRIKKGIALLNEKGIDRSIAQSIITPSCGLGTMGEDRARRVLELTKGVSDEVQGTSTD